MNNAGRMMNLVQAVVDGVAAVASGNVGAMAAKVEQGLATAVPMAISFLAGLLGLGNLPTRVQGIIQKVRKPIEAGIQWLIKQAKALGKQLLNKLRGKDKNADKEKPSQAEQGTIDITIPDGPAGDEIAFRAPDEGHRLWVEIRGVELVVMVASTPQQAEGKLDWVVSEIQSVSNVSPHTVAKLNDLLRRGYNLLNKSEDEIQNKIMRLESTFEQSNTPIDQAAIKAQVDHQVKTFPQNHQLAHVFQELFEILYNLKYRPDERSPKHGTEWYHANLHDAMASVNNEGVYTYGIAGNDNQPSHHVPNMIGARITDDRTVQFGMSAGGKLAPNNHRRKHIGSVINERMNEVEHANPPIN